ncbi:MAG: DUF3579 domain-containing protein [Burkholderiales bacterium]|nr:DUF3579 domain-containing protein [Burkholderiales bacterium]
MSSQPWPDAHPHELVIQGVTQSGERFRPSDWAERLCGMMSVFGEDKHLSYSPYLKPVIADGLSCVVVDGRLQAVDAAAFEFLLGFAHDNELCLRPGRGRQASSASPATGERRVADTPSGRSR